MMAGDDGGKEGWHRLPGLGVQVPMPPRELGIALVTVVLFLPAIILINKLVGVFVPSVRAPYEKDAPKRD